MPKGDETMYFDELIEKFELLVMQFDGVVAVTESIWPTEKAHAMFTALADAGRAAPAVSLVNHASWVGLRYWMEFGEFVPEAAYEKKPTVESEFERVTAVLDSLPKIKEQIIHSFAHKSASSNAWSTTPPQYAGRPEFGRGIALPNAGFVRKAMAFHHVGDKRKVAVIGNSTAFMAAATDAGYTTVHVSKVEVDITYA